jgi:antitoxin component YwqK of YwqJK toxin-antitoxin module
MNDGQYVDGLKDGEWVTYGASGKKMSEGRYKRGQKDGRWILYYPNGEKKSEATFVDGKYSGLYTSYHKNGRRSWEGYYNEVDGSAAGGTKEGPWYSYAEDGETVIGRNTYHRGSRTKPDEKPPFKD